MLWLSDLGAGGSQFRWRHHRFPGTDRRQGNLAIELSPLEQQAGSDKFLASHQRDAHARLVRSAHQRGFLCRGPAPAALVFQDDS